MGTEIAILSRVVRPGMRFAHKHWVVRSADGHIRPDTCTVIAVRRGVVHYQNEAGHLVRSNPSDFVSEVDRWLGQAADGSFLNAG